MIVIKNETLALDLPVQCLDKLDTIVFSFLITRAYLLHLEQNIRNQLLRICQCQKDTLFMSSTAKSRPYLSTFRRSAERNRSLDHHWHTEVYQARLERLKPCRQNHLNDYTIPNATVYKNTYTHTQITTMLRKTQNHNINCAKRAA